MRPGCLLLVALVTLSPALSAGSGHSVTDAPATIRHHQMWVEATVNGLGPYAFVVDTGAEVSILDEPVAEALGLRTGGRFQVGGAGEGLMNATEAFDVRVGFGGFVSRGVDLQVMNLRLLQSGVDEEDRFEGVIGLDVLRGYVLDMDYPARRLRLHLERPALEPRAEWAKVWNGSYLRVDASIQVKGLDPLAGRFAIDTGAAFGVIVSRPFAARTGLEIQARRYPKRDVGRGVGGDLRHRATRMERLTLGGFAVEQVRLAVPGDQSGVLAEQNFDGLIGGEVWERFRLLIDLAEPALALVEARPRGQAP